MNKLKATVTKEQFKKLNTYIYNNDINYTFEPYQVEDKKDSNWCFEISISDVNLFNNFNEEFENIKKGYK